MKALAALVCLLHGVGFAAEELKFKAAVPLPGVEGRFDHFALDTNTHRLFLAALGNDTVEVFDAVAGRHVHTISDQHKPTGVAVAPTRHRLFVANGGDGTVKVYSADTFKLLKSIGGLDDADNVRCDAKATTIYVGYGNGALGLIDAEKLETIGSIQLKGHPESFQLEQKGNRIFVNVPEARHIAVVDREQRAVLITWPMEKFRANFPLALDEVNHRLFVGCRQPARVVVIDTMSGKATADFAISGDTDDLFWDGTGQKIFVSCGAGFVDVFQATPSRSFERVTHKPTAPGARTSFLDADSFYLAVPRQGRLPAELRIFEIPR